MGSREVVRMRSLQVKIVMHKEDGESGLEASVEVALLCTQFSARAP